MKNPLTLAALRHEAAQFAAQESQVDEPSLFGITDGKAIGTYVEHKFQHYLAEHYEFTLGNSAAGIDIPELAVDIKVTSIKQPQSSCPFKSAAQKIYGLGYHLLIFVYEKIDQHDEKTGRLHFHHAIFIDQSRTADFQTTAGILEILARNGNEDDLFAFMMDRHLPVDDLGALQLAQRILQTPPQQGFLTISNALQWRLHYRRAIEQAGSVADIWRLH